MGKLQKRIGHRLGGQRVIYSDIEKIIEEMKKEYPMPEREFEQVSYRRYLWYKKWLE